MDKYVIGLDFGTLSCRAVLVDVSGGQEIATAVSEYSHGVIDRVLPGSNVRLNEGWALQDPQDYIDCLYEVISGVISESGIKNSDIIGIGVDFTSSTILPVNEQGVPLCMLEQYRDRPHSWVKLWKHHAAQYEADKLNELAEARKEEFLKLYGGKISSEWMLPKIMQIVDEDPDIYAAAHSFVEAGDWMVFKLTGKLKRNCCAAGFKAIWNSNLGYPSKDFLKELNPVLENLVEDKLSGKVLPIGTRAGFTSREITEKTGIREDTAVAVASVDAHVTFPAMGISTPGNMVIIVGTSTCNILIEKEEIKVPGISGVVKDSVIPGFYGYEAGQAAVGDMFDWFVRNCIPSAYYEEAYRKGVSIFDLLNEKASRLKAGESGLVCLDWLNGNRSTLVDADLSGMLLGLTIFTKPEEIYRALIEASAFGQKMIVEAFGENGIKVNKVYACGGISHKNPLLMQIYADIMNLNIKVSASAQTAALGAAMFGAVAAGKALGGYDTIEEAAFAMGRLLDTEYKPVPANVAVYDQLYSEYKDMYNYFGKQNAIMKRIKRIRMQLK